MRLSAAWLCALLGSQLGGCQLLAKFEAQLGDAGADMLPSACISGGCVECDPLPGGACPAAGVDGGADGGCSEGDCDQLDDARDPWPTVCNELVYATDFRERPEQDKEWHRVYTNLFVDVKSCGLLEIHSPAHFTNATYMVQEAVEGWSGYPLVETRVVPSLRGAWHVTLSANMATTDRNYAYPARQTRECTLSRRDGALRFESHAHGDDNNRDTWSTNRKDVAFASSAVIQSWIDGSEHVCRLIAPGAAPVEVRTAIETPLAPFGENECGPDTSRNAEESSASCFPTVKFSFANTDLEGPHTWVWIDYLRVYAAP